MDVVVVLAMHGSPPIDFPKVELTEYFSLHARVGHHSEADHEALRNRYSHLDDKMRSWPRTPENDPFYAGAMEMAEHIEESSGYKVIVGFNEFCAPTLDAALEQAVSEKPEKVVVLTPMMTRGGEHAEKDIPQAIERAKKVHPQANIVYAWPFEVSEVGGFLASQIKRFDPQQHK
ncbi:MAG: CbiX/SirB N-terminal domain-containing protein [Thermoplasmata archaeon]|nr:MAG: CbiX/SirB N-terminal domain-containing protein [Thermoplasmata archaeon]